MPVYFSQPILSNIRIDRPSNKLILFINSSAAIMPSIIDVPIIEVQ
ncbi:MAG: hypothetical protein ACJA0N_001386 [Pseudohongiellaceae bacterium]|jgi:hypothetical protein